jgi:hypothetical protein
MAEDRALAEKHFLEYQPLWPINNTYLSGATLGAACPARLVHRPGGMANVWLAAALAGFEIHLA